MKLTKAKEIANATEWSGDIRVNFLTVHKAAKRLEQEVKRLENIIEDGIIKESDNYQAFKRFRNGS